MALSIKGADIICLDAEIKVPIAGEVTWSSYDKMGISVAVIYDFKDGEFKIYMDDNLNELVDRINSADLVTGFHIDGFDIPLIKAVSGREVRPKTYDMLFHARRATGWAPTARFPSGMRLDDLLRETFGPHFCKTADGAQAPHMYQQNKLGRLISYCVADVHREKTLFEHVWDRKPVHSANHRDLTLKHPLEILKELYPDKYLGGEDV